jgi:Mg-chelatase subunit ChlD
MRCSPLVAAAVVALASGCTDRSSPPEGQAPARRERPLAQDGTVARSLTSAPDRVRVQADLATLRAALQTYHAEHAAWPRSLEELSLDGRPSYPADLVYDAASGTVTSQAYPSF